MMLLTLEALAGIRLKARVDGTGCGWLIIENGRGDRVSLIFDREKAAQFKAMCEKHNIEINGE